MRSALAWTLLAPAVALKIAVTGASGYLGCEIAWQAAAAGHEVRAVVRDVKRARLLLPDCAMLEVDDLTNPASARAAADGVDAVIHAASVFDMKSDMDVELVQPNIDLAGQMVAACAANDARLVLTSSMAAVRGPAQPLRPGAMCYTAEDINVVSQRRGPGFEPYQYSKVESERVAWDLAKQYGVDMVSLCPSMLLGPPRAAAATRAEGFSVRMMRRWLGGEAPVQSLLVCDVRDAAAAHVRAACAPAVVGRRFIVSRERRVPAAELAAAIAVRVGGGARVESADLPPGKAAIAIGEREVDAAAALWEALGVRCRPDAETVADMAEALVGHASEQTIQD